MSEIGPALERYAMAFHVAYVTDTKTDDDAATALAEAIEAEFGELTARAERAEAEAKTANESAVQYAEWLEEARAEAKRAEAAIQRAQPVLDAVAAWRAAELPPDAHNKVFRALNTLAIAWDAYAYPEDSTNPTGGNRMSDDDTSAPQEVVREMTARARSMGWDVEFNWRETDDETWSYDAYLWRVSDGTDD